MHENFTPHYDWLYDEVGDIWPPVPGRLVRMLCESSPVGRALDVGCGSGKNARYLAKAGWDVEAFDISRLAIELATGAHPPDTVNYSISDLRTHKYDHNKYDAIILYGVAHCLNDREFSSFIEKIRDSLNVNGRLLLATFTPRLPTPPGHFTRPVFARPLDALLNMVGAKEIVHVEEGDIEEQHGSSVPLHKHSMAWITAKLR